jgi:hypothetical protein
MRNNNTDGKKPTTAFNAFGSGFGVFKKLGLFGITANLAIYQRRRYMTAQLFKQEALVQQALAPG